jgi:hypothetical protein
MGGFGRAVLTKVSALKNSINDILCVPCQAGLLFSGLPAQLKKSRKVGPKQKKHFFCNDPLKNFASNVLGDKKSFGGEILQLTAKKI